MTLVSAPIPSLHNGVSQQSALVRSPDQCELAENAWMSLAEGTGKRAPTETVARLIATAPQNALIHAINRDVTERFIVVVTAGTLRVFDFAGTEQTVTAPAGWGYLSTVEDYSEDLSLTTVKDYTFVTNRRAIPEMTEGDTSADPEYYRWVNRRYGVDGVEVAYGPGSAYQYPPNPVLPAISGTVQSFSKLPETAAQGAVYMIAGTDESAFRTYYVRKNGGVWDECRKPGMVDAIDATTMPHALVRENDGTFVFAPFSWAPRRVGDGDTNPDPVFIGRPIRKVFIYQNRLTFISDENTILSVAGDLGNFWRMTVLDYIDSDVVSLAATSTEVSVLTDAVAFNDGIMLTSDQTQFSLSNGEDGASAVSMAVRPVTNYEVNSKAGMVALGSEVYFASERNGFTILREYTRIDGDDATSASDVTAHVPAYIPAGVHKLIPAVDLGAIFTLTSGDESALYVYQFYWASASEKAQSAHHRWTFGSGARVMSGAYLGGYLYLLIARSNGLCLERMNLQAGAKAPLLNHQCYLDRRAQVTGTFDAGRNRTVITLPYPSSTVQIIRTNAHAKPLSIIDPTTYVFVNATTVEVPGNETAGPLLVGEKYTFRYRFSALYLRRQDGTAITTGRTQLRTFTVSYRNTGFFKTSVAPYGVDPAVEAVIPAKLAQFTGKVLGQADLILNSPAFHTGDYSFSVLGQSDVATIELVNDTHVASTFVSAEYETFYWNRSRA